jgi:hypothetical protein
MDPSRWPADSCRTLEAFVRQSNIVTIPSDDRALVASAPPYNAQNFAYIIVPGPYETNVPATYYIAPPDPRWTPEERAQYVLPDASMLFTSVHEVLAGHFLQFPAFEPQPLACRPASSRAMRSPRAGRITPRN